MCASFFYKFLMYIIKHDSYIKGFASSILLHIRIIYGEREREREREKK
jgi:hypothetical protein